MRKSFYILLLFLASSPALFAQRYFVMDSPIKNISIYGNTDKDTAISFTYQITYHGNNPSDSFSGYIKTCYITRKDSTLRTYSDSPRIYNIRHNHSQVLKVIINTLGSHAFNNGGNNIVIAWPTGTVANNLQVVYAKDSSKNLVGHIVLKGLTGISEGPASFDPLLIYPNPASQSLQLSLKNELIRLKSLAIFDIKGRKVYHSGADVRTIDVGTLPAGLYILQVISADNRIAKYEFIKQ